MTTRTLPGLEAGTWIIDPTHSEVGFVVRHLMVSKVKGRFTAVAGAITVADDVLAASVEATVDAASIDTKEANRDTHLRSAEFLDVEQFPTLTFRSSGIRLSGEDYLMDGGLTIRGNTRPVTFEVEFNGASANPFSGGTPTAGFTAETVISRKEFGLEWNVALEAGGVMVGDKVTIQLEIEATKTA